MEQRTDGKWYSEVPDNRRNWFDTLTSWIQRKTQIPIYPMAYRPVYATVRGFSVRFADRPKDGTTVKKHEGAEWVLSQTWRGWFYGQFDERERLIRNGRFFFRFARPFLIVVSWRYSSKPGARKWDCIIGYPPTGKLAFSPFRFQTDESAGKDYDAMADGHVNNAGQARDFFEGWR